MGDGHHDRSIHGGASRAICGCVPVGRDRDARDDRPAGRRRVVKDLVERVLGHRTGPCQGHGGIEREKPCEELALRIGRTDGTADGRGVADRVGGVTSCQISKYIWNQVRVDDFLKARHRSDAEDLTVTVDAGELQRLQVDRHDRRATGVGGDRRTPSDDHNVGTRSEGDGLIERERAVVLRDQVCLFSSSTPFSSLPEEPRPAIPGGGPTRAGTLPSMSTLLIRHAQVLATMDDDDTEIADGALFAVDGFIEEVGHTADLPDTADEVLDLAGHVVLPGLINTHHHFYQTLTRAVPGAQDVGLFDWLRTLYPIWARLTPHDTQIATQLALSELALSGCTTSSDHQYLFPNASRVDDQVAGAATVGLRFHVARGSMSLGESDGGLPPDSVVEDEDTILADTQRVIEAFNDPTRGSMIRVVVAPCSLLKDKPGDCLHFAPADSLGP